MSEEEGGREPGKELSSGGSPPSGSETQSQASDGSRSRHLPSRLRPMEGELGSQQILGDGLEGVEGLGGSGNSIYRGGSLFSLSSSRGAENTDLPPVAEENESDAAAPPPPPSSSSSSSTPPPMKHVSIDNSGSNSSGSTTPSIPLNMPSGLERGRNSEEMKLAAASEARPLSDATAAQMDDLIAHHDSGTTTSQNAPSTETGASNQEEEGNAGDHEEVPPARRRTRPLQRYSQSSSGGHESEFEGASLKEQKHAGRLTEAFWKQANRYREYLYKGAPNVRGSEGGTAATRDQQQEEALSSLEERRRRKTFFERLRVPSGPFGWEESTAGLKRLIDRDAPFHQSRGYINLGVSTDDAYSYRETMRLRLNDWFDALLTLRTSVVMILLTLWWAVIILVFAGLYQLSSERCSTTLDNPLTFQGAFAFSLETATTVGYTLPYDSNQMFFEGCVSFTVLIFLQTLLCLFVNGFIIGIVMLRIQRADRRANQILFSNQCSVVCIRGRFYLTVQIFDLQGRRPILGAIVRAYAVFHEMDAESPAFWQTRAMRLSRPDDSLGGRLWLSVPTIVVHEIDPWSPLAPACMVKPPPMALTAAPNRFPFPPLRSVDARSGSQTHALCLVCGNAFLTDSALRRHIIFSADREKEEGKPEMFGHRSVEPRLATRPVILRTRGPKVTIASNPSPGPTNTPPPTATTSNAVSNPSPSTTNSTTSTNINAALSTGSSPPPNSTGEGNRGKSLQTNETSSHPSQDKEKDRERFRPLTPQFVRDEIRQRIESRRIEVVIIVEGTDPRTSNSFQARHSYVPEEFVYDRQHAPCLGVSKRGTAEVNLSLFHDFLDPEPEVNIEDPFPFASHS